MYNSITVIGNLGRDPDVRSTEFGRIVSFSVATSEHWKDKTTGDRKERTQWHNIVIFNEPIGKIAEQYLRKGSKVMLIGAMEYREYTDRDDVKRRAAEIVLRPFKGELHLMGDSKAGVRNPDDYGTTTTRGSTAGSRAETTRDSRAPIDDDIPF